MQEDDLEEAIAAYSRQEPRPGMDARIMVRVRSARTKSRWQAAAVVWAVAGVAGIAFVTLRLPPAAITPPTPPVARPPAVASMANVATAQIRRSAGNSRRLPKLGQFPTPAPLTETERGLLAYLNSASDEAREAILEGQEPGTRPIQIEPIEIPLLQNDSKP